MSDASPCCVITGATGGIGCALVAAFRESGYYVIGTDRSDSKKDSKCHNYIQADLGKIVSNELYADDVIAWIRNQLPNGTLHALVNNAAVQVLGGADSLTRGDWRNTLDVNLTAPFLLTQAFLAELELAEGSVVNISSIHAKLTKANFVAYATSKAALSGMTRALAVDLGDRVRVNAVEPAAIETEMLRAGFTDNPEQYASLLDCHPSKRIGSPAEVAEVALMLATDKLGFINGACVELSGGISGRLHDPA